MKKQWKYQAGELVELSAAGKKSQQNTAVVGMIGMIMSIVAKKAYQHGSYPYVIQWLGEVYNVPNGQLPMKEYEIKRHRVAR